MEKQNKGILSHNSPSPPHLVFNPPGLPRCPIIDDKKFPQLSLSQGLHIQPSQTFATVDFALRVLKTIRQTMYISPTNPNPNPKTETPSRHSCRSTPAMVATLGNTVSGDRTEPSPSRPGFSRYHPVAKKNRAHFERAQGGETISEQGEERPVQGVANILVQVTELDETDESKSFPAASRCKIRITEPTNSFRAWPPP